MAELWESELVISTLEEGLSEGLFLGPACERAGLSRITVWRWQQRVEAGTAPASLVAAHERIQAARERGVEVHAAKLRASEDWRAAAWALERLDRDQFGDRTRTELTGAEGGPVQVAAVAAEADALMERLHRQVAQVDTPALPEKGTK